MKHLPFINMVFQEEIIPSYFQVLKIIHYFWLIVVYCVTLIALFCISISYFKCKLCKGTWNDFDELNMALIVNMHKQPLPDALQNRLY